MFRKTELQRVKLSRREFLRASVVAAGGVAIAACAPPAPAGQAPAVTAAPEVEIKTLYIVWRTTLKEQPILEQIFNQFESEHPGVKISRIFLPGAEFDQKVDLMIAAGTPPAIWAPIAARGIRYYAARDLCTALDDFIAQDNYDMSDFYEGSLDLCKWKGQWVGLPMLLVPVIFVYNKTLFDEAGIAPPTKDWDDKSWNWNAFLEIAQKLTKRDASGRATQFAMASLGDIRYVIRAWGVNYYSKEEQDSGYPKKFLGTTPEFIEALQFMGDLINKYKVVPSVAEMQAMQAGAPDLFMTGKVAMAIVGTSIFQTYADIKDFKWGTAAVPWPNQLPRWNYLYPDQYAIIKGQKYPELAWALLKVLASAEGEKLHPIESHLAVGPRKSVADYFVELAMKTSGQPKEEIQTAIDGMKYMSTAPGHATVEWQQFWDKAFKPFMDKVLLGEMTAADAVKEMEPIFNKIVEETTPKS
jgi:multiple sugar transport system substrate-binding protein